VAAGEIAHAVKSRGRSRHGPAIERAVDDDSSAGGKNRRPLAVLDKSRSPFQLWRGLEGQCHQVEPRRADETPGAQGEHLARRPVPPLVPLAA